MASRGNRVKSRTASTGSHVTQVSGPPVRALPRRRSEAANCPNGTGVSAVRVFLSYSRKDEGVVKALARGLEAAHREVWFDHDLVGGDAWWDSILSNIRETSVFIFALS